MKNLTLREKIGQMLIIKIQGKEITNETKRMIEEYKVGGIILYRKNYDTYEEMINIINEIKKINRESGNIPLFISIDQEGGRVTAQMLKESGFNMDYALVLDIQRFEDGHAIGDRCYGKNAEEVSKNGIQIMKELSDGGVIPVIKHFPGHGLTKKDSHFFLPVIDAKIEDLEKEDILPFKRAIGQNAEVIIVGHLVIKDVDKKNPASLSKTVINDYLRNKYQYKGLIMTDDLKMRAISLRYGYVKATMKACKAGADIIMIGAPHNTVIHAIHKIEKNVKNQKIDICQIDKSVEKIIKLKEKYNITDEPAKGCNIEDINEKIEKINAQL